MAVRTGLSRRAVVLSALWLLSATVAGSQPRSLKILLTNDDGFDSAGLTVMRAALVSAGHQVTVVAPASNMSSSSMSMTSGTLKVEGKGDGVWAVHGTPADAAMIGLAHVLKGVPQDLVISGTNAGQNLGSSANASGTVSAAIAASRFGVPAIATSGGIGADAGAAYEVAARLTLQLIAALAAGRPAGERLLPDRLIVNMNVPAVPADRLQGIRWAPLSRQGAFARVFTATENPTEVRSRLTLSSEPLDEKDSDLALFRQGYVTLTVLDGDLGAGAAGAAVASRLSSLTLTAAK
jgi:5'/3'-nucleotidase SurE